MEGIEGYTMHREFKQPKPYNPYYVRSRRKQVQADLIDVSALSGSNDGVRFLLLLIDIFTKRIWIFGIRSKGANAMTDALTTWLDGIDVVPKILKTDKGTEFTNRRVQQLLRNRGVEWQAAFGTLKAAVAERANKTIQILMFKYLSENETKRYIDVLPLLLNTYSNRGHRTLKGMSPNEADRAENEGRVQGIFNERYAKLAGHRRRELPLKVGDVVRIKTLPKKLSASSRAYAQQFTGEYFKVVRINRTLPIALYYLQSLDTLEHIEGGFYAQELQRQTGDIYKVERVLGRRVRNGRREVRVKWMHFGNRWNQWIREADVRRVFRR